MYKAICSVPLSAVLLLLTVTHFAYSQTPPPANASNSEPLKQTVIVTGTWEPVALEESDRSVSELPVQTNVPLLPSLVDLLSQDPSIYVQARGPAGVQADISIRGASFQQTLFLLNGIRTNDEQSAHYNSDFAIPLDAIDHVEVLHGSGSTLYGSDSAGGVVNILTRSSADADPLVLRLRSGFGSFGTNEESGFLSFGIGPLSQRFSFERELSTGFMDDREYRNLSLSSDSWLKSHLGLTRIFLGMDDRPFGADQFYGSFNSWERTKTWIATVSESLGERTSLSFGYRRHSDLFVLLRDNPSFYTNRHIDEGWDGAIRRQDAVSRWAHLSYGTEITADSVTSNNLGIHSRTQGAIYGALDARAVRRASFSVGAREEFYPGGNIFVPNVSGGYWLASTLKLRASISRAFRLPSYTELYYSDPADRGNPNLRPERALNYEAGIDWHPGKHWRLSSTFFDRDEHDGIDYVRASASDIWQATNFDQLNFIGAEADLSLVLPASQTLSAGYTVIHGAESALQGLQSKYVFNYPTQQAIITWQRLAARGWLARVRAGVTDQYQRSAYFLLDASASWSRGRFRPYARLTNITDASYQPVLGVAMPGRAALGGLEITIFGRPD